MLKFKEHERATFFSPSENWCLPASTLKSEEREFVVDSGALMHMISKKDLNSAEVDTLTTSRSPTTLITANGEVHTHEEAIVYVKELDIFLTMKLFGWKSSAMNTDTHTSGSMVKNHISLKKVFEYNVTQNIVPIVVPGLSNMSSGSDSSTSRTLSEQGSHWSTSSSSSSSSPTVSAIKTREREDRTESDISPVTVSTTVDERSVRPDVDQANKHPKPNKKGTQEGTGRPVVCRLRSCKLWNPGMAARIQRKFGG